MFSFYKVIKVEDLKNAPVIHRIHYEMWSICFFDVESMLEVVARICLMKNQAGKTVFCLERQGIHPYIQFS